MQLTKQPSILVVDDEPDNFDVIETLLSFNAKDEAQSDYQLHYAANGQEALQFLDTYNPDLILLDVMMPGINGLETCRQIKAMPKWQPVPIIMVTALSSKSDLAACLSAGADDFISKPVNGIELRARVQSMLRIKRQFDSIQTLSNIQDNTIRVLESTLQELHGNLASRLSHELNTPLNGIIGTIDLLSSYIENMDSNEIQEMLRLAEESAQRLEKLTKKFLIYLELEIAASRQQKVKPQKTNFCPSNVSATLMHIAQNANRADDLTLALTEAVLPLSDRYLFVVLTELFDNALKFSPPHTPIKVCSYVEEEQFSLIFHDSGRGFTEEQVAKIGAFMQFEREVYEQQGLGMGLRIVQRIVELSGGTLSISSHPKQETIIQITWPILDS
ncbi:MAG TPA: hybrid sensor histidine kinase/response regulator [Stenomitos sp.]